MTQIVDWNTRFQQNLRMGINISPKQLNSTNLLTELNLLAQNQTDPQWLDIELTENIAMDGEYRMSQIFKLFKSIGLSVSIPMILVPVIHQFLISSISRLTGLRLPSP